MDSVAKSESRLHQRVSENWSTTGQFFMLWTRRDMARTIVAQKSVFDERDHDLGSSLGRGYPA